MTYRTVAVDFLSNPCAPYTGCAQQCNTMVKSSTSVIVQGASGRVGARLCALALDDPAFSLAGALTHARSTRLGQPCAPHPRAPRLAHSTDAPADAVIDFSCDPGTRAALGLALARPAALLVGTTALADDTRALLRDAAARIPVLLAANTSTGVAVLADLTRRTAAALGAGYAASIVEAHHARKKDAPSGTALSLAESARAAGAALPPDQILSIRSGDVVGEHTVRFAGPGEYLELTHRATSRDVFARGALRAAAWLAGRPAGWYTMDDVLGLTG